MTIEHRMRHSVFAGAASFAVTFCQSVLFVPLMLRFWNENIYGLWLSLFAVSGLLQTLDQGHQNYLGNEFCKYYSTDITKLKELISSGLFTAFFSALLQIGIVVCGLAFGLFPKILNIDAFIVHKQRLDLCLLILTLTWLFTGSAGGLLVRLYAPAGLYARSVWLGVLGRMVQTFGILAALILGGSLLQVCFVSSGTVFLFNLYLFYDLSQRFRHLKPFLRFMNPGIGWFYFKKSLFLTLISTAQQVMHSGLILYIARSWGAGTVVVYTTLRTLSGFYGQGALWIAQPALPEMVRYRFQREFEKLSAALAALSWFSILSMWPLILLSLPFIDKVYSIWTQGEVALNLPLFFLMILFAVLSTLALPFKTYLSGMNLLKEQALMVSVYAGFVILGLLTLTPFYGLYALGLSLILGEALGSLGISMACVKKELKKQGWDTPKGSPIFLILYLLNHGFVLMLMGNHWINDKVILGYGLLSFGMISFMQYSYLPIEVKKRLFSLFRLRLIPWTV